jgi:glycosyltransferase 2 family protein
LNWRLLAIPASIIPLLIMFLYTHLSPAQIFAVGLVPFMISTASVMGRVMLQAFRFEYFIRAFIGRNVASVGSVISARLAGEFVTQTTPSFIGGEVVRIAFLTKNGVPAGRAAWVTTMEIIADVLVGTMLAFIAGAIAIYNGGGFIGITVILVAIPTLMFWLSLVLLSAKRNLTLPAFAIKLLKKFISQDKAEKITESTNTALTDLCKMSRENFNSNQVVRIFLIGIGITFVAFVLQGISFMVLANAVGSDIGIFESLLATSASTAISTIPITIGGSGLAELGIWAYISRLNGIPSLNGLAMSSELNVVIAWRIASYHVPLVIMWVALMRMTMYKFPFKNKKVLSASSLFGKRNKIPDTNEDLNKGDIDKRKDQTNV